jgi:predicted NACHT family NTPase
MTRISYGDQIKGRTRRLLEALLSYANHEFDDSDRFDIQIKWQDESQLVLRTKLRVLESLTREDKYDGSLTKGQIRESLNRMQDFLDILKDNRTATKGSENWHFTLKLWCKDKENNLEYFDREWDSRRPEKSKQTAMQAPLTKVPDKAGTFIDTKKNLDINSVVQELRQKSKERILQICKMRMLKVRYPVPVSDIYVDLNLLEQPSSECLFIEQLEQLQTKETEPKKGSFYRIGLSRPLKEHIPALEIVRNHPKLMILGKPGSGKTTLLKALTSQCIQGKLDWNNQLFIPIFITLINFSRDFSALLYKWEPGETLVLLQAIKQELNLWRITDDSLAEYLATEGKIWLLLDGLDEVPEKQAEYIIQQIRLFCDSYSKNRITVTCRTQQQRYRFNNELIDVEVADFTPSQVEVFIKQWFRYATDKKQIPETHSQKIFTQLKSPENKAIAELAVTPILLNLICVYAHRNEGTLPKNRASLYKKGIRYLLIEGDEIKDVKRSNSLNLSMDTKENLLSNIAFDLFINNIYIPTQEKLEDMILNRLNCHGRHKADAILKSLENEHGLLIQRAEEYWSFSHLTLQEYFTSQY